jgi:hypothetical protein
MFCYSVTITQKNNLEQRYAIKFCVKVGEGATDTYGKIEKAFGNDSVSHTQVFWWYKEFARERETVEDEQRSGRPAFVRIGTDVNRVRAFVRQDGRSTIGMTADDLNSHECTVHQTVTQNLNMRKVCAEMVSKNLNDDQRARRKEVSAEMLERLETEPDILNWVVIGNESWFFEYDPETKRQSEEW